jgi:hypothetical protein
MATYTTDGRSGKLLRRGRELLALAFAGDPYRPAILNFLFWGSLLVTYVFHVSGFFNRTQLALYAVERGWTERARSPEPPSAGRA